MRNDDKSRLFSTFLPFGTNFFCWSDINFFHWPNKKPVASLNSTYILRNLIFAWISILLQVVLYYSPSKTIESSTFLYYISAYYIMYTCNKNQFSSWELVFRTLVSGVSSRQKNYLDVTNILTWKDFFNKFQKSPRWWGLVQAINTYERYSLLKNTIICGCIISCFQVVICVGKNCCFNQ